MPLSSRGPVRSGNVRLEARPCLVAAQRDVRRLLTPYQGTEHIIIGDGHEIGRNHETSLATGPRSPDACGPAAARLGRARHVRSDRHLAAAPVGRRTGHRVPRVAGYSPREGADAGPG